MDYSTAKAGDYIRFKHHDGTGRNNPPAPVFRLREVLTWTHDDTGKAIAHEPTGELERVCVVPFPPYRRGHVLPFTPDNADAFVPASMPVRSVPAASKRSDRSGTRRRAR